MRELDSNLWICDRPLAIGSRRKLREVYAWLLR